MKIRIIPTILTDGITVVKGQNFDNWRTVGNAQATARLFGARDVDELMFLDVTARKRGTTISQELIKYFSENLTTPFSVGGGINNLSDAETCFKLGAEKIVLGTSSIENPNLIREISDNFGSQALIVSLDVFSAHDMSLRIHSGSVRTGINVMDIIVKLENLGAGELLLQSISNDGTLIGFDSDPITKIRQLTNLPIIASGGISSALDVKKAVDNGADAVAIGALFQFTEITPQTLAEGVKDLGIETRYR